MGDETQVKGWDGPLGSAQVRWIRPGAKPRTYVNADDFAPSPLFLKPFSQCTLTVVSSFDGSVISLVHALR